MATLRELADYYVDRLIVQYRTKTKARDTIAISVKQAMADDLGTQLLNAFTVDTAVGPQLDIIGKYAGVPRNIGLATAQGYFGLWTYNTALILANYQGTWDPVTDTPALPDPTTVADDWYVASAPGNSTTPIINSWLAGDIIISNGIGWQRQVADNGNGLTTYADLASNAAGIFYSYSTAARQASDLTDTSYRTVIKLKIILNSNDGTLSSIMALLWEFFPNQISLTDNTDMTLNYQVLSSVPLSKELLEVYLPKPMGVGITVTIVSPTPGGGDALVTEDGFTLVTEDGDTITTEPTS